MNADEMITLAALGRPFSLGMLYDRRKDELVPGIKLWDPDQLQMNITEKPQPGSQYDIIATDSMEEKTSSLDVDASLKLSLLGGMVSIGGSAKFINDRKSSSSQSRVSLKYRSTSFFQELTMKHLGSGQILHPEIFDKKIATHVVVGILYGSQAYFVFDREVSESEDRRKIHGDLEVMIKAIPGVNIEGKGSLDMDDKSKTIAKNLTCRFYGDVCLPKNPTTYEEAVRIYQQLPSYIGEKGENSVPFKVWLYPLSKLDSKAQQLVRDISNEVIKKIEENLENLEEFRAQCNDLLAKNTCQFIPEIKNRIENFKSLVQAYKHRFQAKLAEILPKVRGFGMEEKELLNLLENQAKSPFSINLLKSWVTERKQEMSVLDAYVKSLQKIYISTDEGDITAKSFEHDHVLLLNIVLPLTNDNLLLQMTASVNSGEETIYSSSNYSQWFKDKKTQAVMRKMLKLFASFVEDNKECQDLFCMVSITEDEQTESGKCAYMTFYENGVAVHEDFEPPGKPGKPEKVNSSTGSITIQWEAPKDGTEFVHHYEGSYRNVTDGEWQYASTEGKTTALGIGGLIAKTPYEFRVRAVCIRGTCQYGDMSDEIVTTSTLAREVKTVAKQVKPGTPSVYKLPVIVTNMNLAGKTRKCEFGTRSKLGDALTEKTIMVVGATGAGKSTLIDGFINYIVNVEWEDDFRFSLVDLLPEEAEKESEADSRTEWITTYKINYMEGSKIHYTLNIIDTPGFGDTRGIKRDKEITEQVRQLFTDKTDGGVTCIDAICFVTQAPLARLTPSQKYIFSSILSIFGSDIVDNISVLISFADGNRPPVLDALRVADVPFKKEFRFNNSALFASNDPSETESFAPMFWKMGIASFRKFFTDLGLMKTKSLTLTKEVLEERRALELIIGGLQPEIDHGLCELDALRQEEKELERHKEDIEHNRDFKYQVPEVRTERVIIPGKPPSTFCTDCEKECHDVCAIANNHEKSGCVAIDGNGYCKVCPGKCHWNSHLNVPYRLQTVTKMITKVHESKKQNLAKAKNLHKEKFGVIDNIKRKLADLERKVTSMINSMIGKITRLRKIALKPNPLTAVDYIDQMIEAENSERKSGYKMRITELQEQRQKAELLHKAERGQLNAKFQ